MRISREKLCVCLRLTSLHPPHEKDLALYSTLSQTIGSVPDYFPSRGQQHILNLHLNISLGI